MPPRRKSLGDLFQTVRAKWHHETISDVDKEPDVGSLSLFEEPSVPLVAESVSEGEAELLESFKSILKPDPPQLNVLSGYHESGLQRSSTFRTCIEKAVADINAKYGSTHSLSCKHRDTLRSSPRHKSLPTHGHAHPPGWFRPDLKSIIGDETLIPSYDDILTEPLEQLTIEKSASNIGSACQSCGTSTCCRSPDKRGIPSHQIDKILGESIDIRDPPQVCSKPDSSIPPELEHHIAHGHDLLKDTSVVPLQFPLNDWKLIEENCVRTQSIGSSLESVKDSDSNPSLDFIGPPLSSPPSVWLVRADSSNEDSDDAPRSSH